MFYPRVLQCKNSMTLNEDNEYYYTYQPKQEDLIDVLTNSSDKQTAHPYDEDRVVHYSPGYNKQYETTTMNRYSVRTRISAGRLNSKLSISPIALGVVPRKDEECRQFEHCA